MIGWLFLAACVIVGAIIHAFILYTDADDDRRCGRGYNNYHLLHLAVVYDMAYYRRDRLQRRIEKNKRRQRH